MAGTSDPSDYDRLLAEVEQSLQGGAPSPAAKAPVPKKRGASPEPAARGSDATRMPATTRALIAGVTAGVLVFVLFLFLAFLPGPFFSVWSGSIGAFLGAAGTALVLRRR